MMGVRGYCVTNLDSYKREEFPEYFVAVPREGEWVASKNGKILTVVKVTHECEMKHGEPHPRIRVELHR